jgi:hypothetical protein
MYSSGEWVCIGSCDYRIKQARICFLLWLQYLIVALFISVEVLDEMLLQMIVNYTFLGTLEGNDTNSYSG